VVVQNNFNNIEKTRHTRITMAKLLTPTIVFMIAVSHKNRLPVDSQFTVGLVAANVLVHYSQQAVHCDIAHMYTLLLTIW
jgi:hypothetical protein